MSEPEYLDAVEVAARLGISLRTVRRRIADSSLPSVRIGRAVRVPAVALDLPVGRPAASAIREAVAPYEALDEDDQAAYVARWNYNHWPDTWERMLERRRRAFDRLDAIRATSKPPSGPHDTVDAILDAVREEFGARFDWIIAGLPEPPEEA
jgi:excisionase family DNA binding protein